MTIKYFVRKNLNDPDMVTCPVCNGSGKIVGSITSPSLPEPRENIQLSCPHCGGSGEITTGKFFHYKVGQVFLYGEARVNDDDREQEYNLGFVSDDFSKIEEYKKANHITSFIDYPASLVFYAKNETLYDTFEEAQAEVDRLEAEYTPDKARENFVLA